MVDMEWIKCSEQLPNIKQYIITRYNGEIIEMCYLPEQDVENPWWASCGECRGFRVGKDEITLWIPSPLLPKAEKMTFSGG